MKLTEDDMFMYGMLDDTCGKYAIDLDKLREVVKELKEEQGKVIISSHCFSTFKGKVEVATILLDKIDEKFGEVV